MLGKNNRWQFTNPSASQRAARLLGISMDELTRILFEPGSCTAATSSRSSFRTPSPTGSDSKGTQSLNGVESLEGLAEGLYTEVFSAVAALINR